jgi:hypothetical protein
MIVELEVDGEIIEVEEAYLESLVAKIRRNRPQDQSQVVSDCMAAVAQSISMIPAIIEKGVAEIKIPPPVAPKQPAEVQKIVVSNVQRGRDRLIESLELKLYR